MYETIEQIIDQMTCEGLTAAYVILRELTNLSQEMTLRELIEYIDYLRHFVSVTHTKKLEDMRREFYEGRQNNVQH